MGVAVSPTAEHPPLRHEGEETHDSQQHAGEGGPLCEIVFYELIPSGGVLEAPSGVASKSFWTPFGGARGPILVPISVPLLVPISVPRIGARGPVSVPILVPFLVPILGPNSVPHI